MISLLPHQKDVLALSKNRNRVSVKGYEGLYDIDTFGNIYTVKYNKPLKPYIKNGYLAVNLYKDKKCKHHYIHRLVASTFLNNDKNLPEVNHIDCNKHNNSVSNLEWCDRKHNLVHSYNNGLKRTGEKHGMHKLTELQVISIRKEYVKGNKNYSLHALARKYGVNWCTIQAIVKGKLWGYLLCS